MIIQSDTYSENPLRDAIFNYLIFLMKVRDQLRINHWQTKAYSEHKATDSMIGYLSDYIDKIGESALGCLGRPEITTQDNSVTDMNLFPSTDVIDKIKEYTVEMLNQTDNVEYEGINALLGELHALASKVKYLLTLE